MATWKLLPVPCDDGQCDLPWDSKDRAAEEVAWWIIGVTAPLWIPPFAWCCWLVFLLFAVQYIDRVPNRLKCCCRDKEATKARLHKAKAPLRLARQVSSSLRAREREPQARRDAQSDDEARSDTATPAVESNRARRLRLAGGGAEAPSSQAPSSRGSQERRAQWTHSSLPMAPRVQWLDAKFANDAKRARVSSGDIESPITPRTTWNCNFTDAQRDLLCFVGPVIGCLAIVFVGVVLVLLKSGGVL